ncbi:uncharacterized protein LOC111343534 [Stylophora pistillata]|uniref:Uncharacterized protein n=1 Tax=Stylophora pistillata TaxID=50429 RepID=A0A2B4RGF3_STYPI|nr:uncharacterized protein LOC111343534 [Stylophora pistillata]PFX15458.1 hypothetical protein AWC38_SpisGene20319 [Stylophora pistillata]
MQHNPGVFILVHIMVISIHLIPKHVTEAAVVNNCTGPVHSTSSCDEITYEEVYDILTKSQNSFNIESALYPPKRPSSVRVFVNVYGPNGTDRSTPAAKYTWSTSCLYAALPATVLEFWSLWAIQVTRRTQRLNITISITCCDVTKGILKKHIEDALAALEDLAIKPTLRDPRLNSAECVIEGHRSDIIATGHKFRIVVVLVCSIIFPVLIAPFLAFLAWQYRQTQTAIERLSMDTVCKLLVIIVTAVNIAKEIVVHGCEREEVPALIEAMQPIIFALDIMFVAFINWYRFHKFIIFDREVEDRKLFFYIVCANLVAYHFFWLVVGITLNPLWGLFDLLGICLFVGALSYYVYQYYYLTNERLGPGNGNVGGSNSNIYRHKNFILVLKGDNTCETTTNQSSGPGNDKGNGNNNNNNNNGNNNNVHFISRWQSFYWSVSCVLVTICFLIAIILTGQSYNGKETAHEVFKDVVGYLFPISFAWLCWKSRRDIKIFTPATNSQPVPDEDPFAAFTLDEVKVEN